VYPKSRLYCTLFWSTLLYAKSRLYSMWQQWKWKSTGILSFIQKNTNPQEIRKLENDWQQINVPT
jgi:hypothetical protein